MQFKGIILLKLVFTMVFCFVINVLHAQIHTLFAPETYSEITRSHQISGYPYTMPVVIDGRFSEMTSSNWRQNYKHRKVLNRIKLSVLDTNLYVQDYHYLIIMKIRTFDLNNNMDSTEVELEISYDPNIGTPYLDLNIYQFTGFHKFETEILDVKDLLDEGNSIPADSLKHNFTIEQEISVERYYLNDYNFTINRFGTQLNTNKTLTVHWNFNDLKHPLWYELEWTYIPDHGYATSKYDFNNNSSRIQLTDTAYKLNLVYETGYLLFRVRTVRLDSVDYKTLRFGDWLPPTPSKGQLNDHDLDYSYHIQQAHHEDSLNWQYSAAYAEWGKKKEIVSYYDGTLRNRQSVTYLSSEDESIVQEVIYDYLGRPVINVLPAPSGNSELKFYHNFNLNTSGQPYSVNDLTPFIGGTECSGTLLVEAMDNTSGASGYYSSNNSNTDEHNAYLPDAFGYPFIHTEYTSDQTGRVRRQGGVGIDHQLNTGRETINSYGKPTQSKLFSLFGTETGKSEHYEENIVIDPNGQISISYLDKAGRVIATTLVGNPPPQLLGLNSQPENAIYDITDLIIEGDAIPTPNGYELTHNFHVNQDNSEYSFDYSLNVPGHNDLCIPDGLCLECVYDLSITLLNDCDEQLFHLKKQVGSLQNMQKLCEESAIAYIFKEDFDSLYSDQPSLLSLDDSIRVMLDIGKYTLKKTLTLNNEAVDSAAKYLVENDTCMLPLQHFIQLEIDKIDSSSCDDCDTCLNTLTRCSSLRSILMADVSPGGQYAHYDSVKYYTSDKASIFYNFAYKELGSDFPDTAYIYTSYLGNTEIVYARNLPLGSFLNLWNDKWAESLIKLHPEYCYLQYCESELEPAEDFISSMLNTKSFLAAKDSGYLNPLNMNAYFEDPGFDPYFFDFDPELTEKNNAVDIKFEMLNYLTFGDPPTETTLDIWQIAAMITFCSDYDETSWISEVNSQGFLNCYNSYSDWDIISNIGDNEAYRDRFWFAFRSLYFGLREKYIEDNFNPWRLSNNIAIGVGCKSCPYNPDISSVSCSLAISKKNKRFISHKDAEEKLQRYPGSGYPYGYGEVDDIVDSLHTLKETMLNLRCAVWAENWIESLSNCDSFDVKKDTIIYWLTYVCSRAGVEKKKPDGLGATRRLSPYADTAGFRASFHDVLNHFLGEGYQNNLCDTLLIDFPYGPGHAYVLAPELDDSAICQCLAEPYHDSLGYERFIHRKITYTCLSDTLTGVGNGIFQLFEGMVQIQEPFDNTLDLSDFPGEFDVAFLTQHPDYIGRFYATESEGNFDLLTINLNGDSGSCNVYIHEMDISKLNDADQVLGIFKYPFDFMDHPKKFSYRYDEFFLKIVIGLDTFMLRGRTECGKLFTCLDYDTIITDSIIPVHLRNNVAGEYTGKTIPMDFEEWALMILNKTGKNISHETLEEVYSHCYGDIIPKPQECNCDEEAKIEELYSDLSAWIETFNELFDYEPDFYNLEDEEKINFACPDTTDFLLRYSKTYIDYYSIFYHPSHNIWFEDNDSLYPASLKQLECIPYAGGVWHGEDCNDIDPVKWCYITFGYAQAAYDIHQTDTFGIDSFQLKDVIRFDSLRFECKLAHFVVDAVMKNGDTVTLIIQNLCDSINCEPTYECPEIIKEQEAKSKINVNFITENNEAKSIQCELRASNIQHIRNLLSKLAQNNKLISLTDVELNNSTYSIHSSHVLLNPDNHLTNNNNSIAAVYKAHSVGVSGQRIYAKIGDEEGESCQFHLYPVSGGQITDLREFQWFDEYYMDEESIEEFFSKETSDVLMFSFLLKGYKVESGDTISGMVRVWNSCFPASSCIDFHYIGTAIAAELDCGCMDCSELNTHAQDFRSKYPDNVLPASHPNFQRMFTNYMNQTANNNLSYDEYKQHLMDCRSDILNQWSVYTCEHIISIDITSNIEEDKQFVHEKIKHIADSLKTIIGYDVYVYPDSIVFCLDLSRFEYSRLKIITDYLDWEIMNGLCSQLDQCSYNTIDVPGIGIMTAFTCSVQQDCRSRVYHNLWDAYELHIYIEDDNTCDSLLNEFTNSLQDYLEVYDLTPVITPSAVESIYRQSIENEDMPVEIKGILIELPGSTEYHYKYIYHLTDLLKEQCPFVHIKQKMFPHTKSPDAMDVKEFLCLDEDDTLNCYNCYAFGEPPGSHDITVYRDMPCESCQPDNELICARLNQHLPDAYFWFFKLFTDSTHISESRDLSQNEINTLINSGVLPANTVSVYYEFQYTGTGSTEAEITFTINQETNYYLRLFLTSASNMLAFDKLKGVRHSKEGNPDGTLTLSSFGSSIEINVFTEGYPLIGDCCEKSMSNTRICFRRVLPPFPDPAKEDCIDKLFAIAEIRAELKYEKYLDSMYIIKANEYKAHCLGNLSESFVMGYWDMTHHWTLYYYDRAGNLVQTVPPAGANPMVLSSNDKDLLNSNLENYDPEFYFAPDHKLTTKYQYNSINAVSWQYTPDGDSTRFFYDRAGRIVSFQNANQRLKGNVFSYTVYDAESRIIEVGEILNSTAPNQNSLINNLVYFNNWLSNGMRKEITRTFYDDPINDIEVENIFEENGQENLRSRVAAIAYYPFDSVGYMYATHYSYDFHGNVKTVVQDNPSLAVIFQRFKRIDYYYDLVSGNVNLLAFQHARPDQFFHSYEYDADNRITKVLTSRDSIIWDRDAAYFYYRHGPLARTELGQNNVQGIDYAYTIHGWLKGVNSNSLSPEHDIGKDGSSVDPLGFARDAFGFSLGYYGGDYEPIVSSAGNFLASTANSPLDNSNHFLYNGNISHMVTSIRPFMADGKPQASLYKYDQLNRLAGMQTTKDFDVNNNTWNNASLSTDYMTSYEYDANGNLLFLQRNATDQWGQREMDDLEYFYYPGTNRLEYVTDAVHDTMYYAAKTDIEDIDNQQSGNYEYDRIGNLVKDRAEGIDTILWNVYGKVSKVLRENQSDAPDLWFDYDAMGQRVRKTVSHGGFEFNRQYTYYARDAQGNVMATYKRNSEISGGLDSAISALTQWIIDHNDFGFDSLVKLMQVNFSSDVNFKNLYISHLESEPLFMETIARFLTVHQYLGYDSTLSFMILENFSTDTVVLKGLLTHFYSISGLKEYLLVDPIMDCGLTEYFIEMVLTHDEPQAELLNCIANINAMLIEFIHTDVFGFPIHGPGATQTMIDNLMDFSTPPASPMAVATAVMNRLTLSEIKTIIMCISEDLWWRSINPDEPYLPVYHIFDMLFTDMISCVDAGLLKTFFTGYMNFNTDNYDLVEDIFFTEGDLAYFLYLMSIHKPEDFIEQSMLLSTSILNDVLIDHESFSFETYLSIIANKFGTTYSEEAFLDIMQEFIFTERYVLENLYLYGSNRLGMKSPQQIIYERILTISGVDSEGNYIIDEILEADSAVVQDTLAQRILTQKQYELSNHLGNVLVTVTDRRNPIESTTTPGTIAYYEADIASAQDYYPFGMLQPGRHGDTATYTYCDTTYKDSVITKYSEDFSSGTGNWATGTVPFSVLWDGANERMELEGDDDGSYAYLQFSPGNFESGVEYELTMDVELTNSGQNILIDVLEGTTSLISFYTVPYENGNYHPVEIQFTPGSSTSVIEIRIFRMGATNTEIIYVDNVLITYKIPVVDTVVCEVFGYELAGGYRYGFNSREMDSEWNSTGNMYDFGFRIYNPRLGRFLSVDPLFQSYPWYTPYQFGGNSPIRNIDLDGLEEENYLIKMLYDWLFGPIGATTEEEINESINNRNFIQDKVDNVQELTKKLNDGGHLLLDAFGMVPVVGEIADGINALWYYSEGDNTNAALSLAAMVPFVGWASTGLKLAGKTIGNVGEFYKATSKLDIPERIAKYKEVAKEIAKENKWTRNTNLEKKNPGRTIYTDEKGMNYSLDTQHGRFEILNNKGKHQGEIDFSGQQTKQQDKSGKHDIIIN